MTLLIGKQTGRLVPLYRNPESDQLDKLPEISIGEAGPAVSTQFPRIPLNRFDYYIQ